MSKVAAFVILSFSLLHAEGTLFGPSKSELAAQQAAIENKNELDFLRQRVQELNERVDGLTTVVEGLNASMNKLQTLQSGVSAEDFALLSAKVDRLSQNPSASNTMPPRGEQGNRVDTGTQAISSSIKPTSNEPSEQGESASSFTGKSDADLYSEGVRLFQQQKFSESEMRFLATEKNNYKAASGNFYLGEIAYYTKKYKDAIFYYKKSAKLDDKATYIDTLLLHAGISLEGTGDKAQAKNFYESIISGYPDAKSAKIAKERLREL